MPLFAPVTHTVAFSIALCVEYVARGVSHARPRVRFTPFLWDGDILRVVVGVGVVESRDLVGDIRAASQSAALQMAFSHPHYVGTQKQRLTEWITNLSARRRRTRSASRRAGSEDASHEALNALARMDSSVLCRFDSDARGVFHVNNF